MTTGCKSRQRTGQIIWSVTTAGSTTQAGIDPRVTQDFSGNWATWAHRKIAGAETDFDLTWYSPSLAYATHGRIPLSRGKDCWLQGADGPVKQSPCPLTDGDLATSLQPVPPPQCPSGQSCMPAQQNNWVYVDLGTATPVSALVLYDVGFGTSSCHGGGLAGRHLLDVVGGCNLGPAVPTRDVVGNGALCAAAARGPERAVFRVRQQRGRDLLRPNTQDKDTNRRRANRDGQFGRLVAGPNCAHRRRTKSELTRAREANRGLRLPRWNSQRRRRRTRASPTPTGWQSAERRISAPRAPRIRTPS